MPNLPDTVYMLVDPETREALRLGETEAEQGPAFFTSRELLERYAEAEGLSEYSVHAVPGGILSRMRGRPHWVDGRRPDGR